MHIEDYCNSTKIKSLQNMNQQQILLNIVMNFWVL